MSMHEYSTDWDNIDLERASERDKDILNSYNFETLLLEIQCNLEHINKQKIIEHFESEIQKKMKTAREIFIANLDNILERAKKERKES